MYIGVHPYKEISLLSGSKVLVFDTEDFSLEFVDYKECLDCGITLLGLRMTVDTPRYSSYSNFANALINLDCDEVIREGRLILSDTARYRRYRGERIYAERQNLGNKHECTVISFSGFPVVRLHTGAEWTINGVPVFKNIDITIISLLYIFEFNNYTIVRLRIFSDSIEYGTAVLDHTGVVVCIYDENFEYVIGDRALAVKIDTLSRY